MLVLMTRKILLVLHQAHSESGRVGALLSTLGYELDTRRPCAGQALPETLDEHDAAIVFGGPMSANDDLDFIRRELDWLPDAAASGKPLLGICLGAQLLARAAGGNVGPHPEGHHEIGYYAVEPTDAGRELFDGPMQVFHWHGEGVDLPAGAVHLARGETFPVQAFRVGDTAFGIQFHPEVTRAQMERWTTKAAHKLTLPGAQSREAIEAGWHAHDARLESWLGRFLPRWLASGGPAATAL
jgi:GMP synthase (glutamine-hydrolysing)